MIWSYHGKTLSLQKTDGMRKVKANFCCTVFAIAQIKKVGGKAMNTTAMHKETVKMGVSSIADIKFLKNLAKRMGWTFEHERRTGLDEAIEDLKAGRVHKAKNVDELMAQLLK